MFSMTLTQLLEIFAKLPDVAELADPIFATRRCRVTSEAFQTWLELNGYQAALVGLECDAHRLNPEALERWGISALEGTVFHWVVAHEDLYIDWTARQFDASLPVPQIAPHSSFEAMGWRVAPLETTV